MSIFFDKLLNLCTVGATIILIHHSTRADVERYANSHQIGANVARAFAVVSEKQAAFEPRAARRAAFPRRRTGQRKSNRVPADF